MNDSPHWSARSEAVNRGSINTESEDILDRYFLGCALELAWRAAGQTRPNPLVGAIIVNNGKIIGEGYHERSGCSHAEAIALEKAGVGAKGGTLYVTLEPCTHHGKTPPCVDRVTSSGVRKVVICTLDPDPRVSGRGFEKLRASGIRVEVGCLKEQAMLLNLAYFKQHLDLGCTVTLKIAATMDGKIASAPGRRDQITGKAAQVYTHKLRAMHEALLIGVDTLLTDLPRLDCRLIEEAVDPIPVVLDLELCFPEDHPWIEEGRRFFVCCGESADSSKLRKIEKVNGRVIQCKTDSNGVVIKEAVAKLASEGIKSILVEGGGRVFSSFIEKNVWDALYTFVSPSFFGEGGVAMYKRRFAFVETAALPVDAHKVDGDFLLRYLNEKTQAKLLGSLILK